MAPVKKIVQAGGDTKTYVVRPGFVVHRERQVVDGKGRSRTVVDIFNGDDPDSNEVELADDQYPKYAHQLEPLSAVAEVI